MSKVLVDREDIEAVRNTLANGGQAVSVLRWAENILAQPEDPEGFEIARHSKRLVEQLRSDLSAERARADVAVADANDAERALVAVTAERDRLLSENARLIEDRARFPDRPDDIGHMIGSHIGNLKAGKVQAEKYARKWRDNLDSEIRAADQLRAEVERYVPLHEAVQRAARELPEGWAIQLYIERDGGGVELIGPAGTEDFATNNERLDYTVIDALEAAMAAKEA